MSDKETNNKQLRTIGKVRTHNMLGHGVIAGDFQQWICGHRSSKADLTQVIRCLRVTFSRGLPSRQNNIVERVGHRRPERDWREGSRSVGNSDMSSRSLQLLGEVYKYRDGPKGNL